MRKTAAALLLFALALSIGLVPSAEATGSCPNRPITVKSVVLTPDPLLVGRAANIVVKLQNRAYHGLRFQVVLDWFEDGHHRSHVVLGPFRIRARETREYVIKRFTPDAPVAWWLQVGVYRLDGRCITYGQSEGTPYVVEPPCHHNH